MGEHECRGPKEAFLMMGKMRAGKSLSASVLSEIYGIPVYSLAGKLKELHQEMTGCSEKDRAWLQNTGQAHRRVFGADFWVDRLTEHIAQDSPESWIVDDVRYENELTRLYDFAMANGYRPVTALIRVSEEFQLNRGAEYDYLDHESEQFSASLQKRCGHKSAFYQDDGQILVRVLDGDLPREQFMRSVVSSLVPMSRW